ncbi:AraC family transcriptional regulator [Reyranella sp. CPCC 100927]|uniref:helix-turn-helix domain-containing protein n=1 Tax=Reyranella sp. CPCC 100927 TaxID=2599616 RepID=UPI0011B4623A|nr:AraC family transcriptional regulator [Reyranella sp. CPCC 100927]TWT11509.1 helix-turn-helix transcriptional regulator [Reyranella sp. CPCC 100927]
MTWVEKIQLSADDAVFDGADAQRFRQLLQGQGRAALVDGVAGAPSVSLREQGMLAAELQCHGLLANVLAVPAFDDLADLGVAGQVVATSAGLRSVIGAINAFAPLLNVRSGLAMTFRGGDVIIGLRPWVAFDETSQSLLVALDVAKVARVLSCLLMGDAVVTDVDRGELRLPAERINRLLPGANRLANQAATYAARRLMRDMEEARLRESVCRLLRKSGEDTLSLGESAAQLGLSARTFRRRLAEQGTTFVQIRDEMRCALALDYLTTGGLTTEMIAQRLGYSEGANFRHAFRRWTGSSPRIYAAARCADGHALLGAGPAA